MRQRLTTIWVIAYRELATRARSKAFRISSAVMLAGMVAAIALPVALARGGGHYTVAVTGGGSGQRAAIAAQAAAAGLTVTIRPVAGRAAAAALVRSGSAAAAAVGSRELIWKNGPDGRLSPVLTAALASLQARQRASQLGLTPAQASRLLAPAGPAVTRLVPQPDREPQGAVALVGMIVLFIVLNLYGSFVLTGVVEEKTTRVVELLLARVRPADLLAGKVVGIGLLGIGQFAALAAVAAVTLRIVQPPRLPAATPTLIAGVVLWFILGYSFYSVLYGALGALASRTEDAQAAVAPLSVFLMLTYFSAFTTLANPHAWWVTAASLFPPTAPIFMPLRSALTNVPPWQTTCSLVLMVLGILALVWAGGRVYRGAVLHTGGRLRLRQAWRGVMTSR